MKAHLIRLWPPPPLVLDRDSSYCYGVVEDNTANIAEEGGPNLKGRSCRYRRRGIQRIVHVVRERGIWPFEQ